MKKYAAMAVGLLCAWSTQAKAETWNLQQCLDYALENNITINKNRVAEETGESSLTQYKSQLWPSLTFSTSQNMTYRPLQQTAEARTVDGQVTASANKVVGNGSYNLSMNWTIWDGGVNYKNVEKQKVSNKIAVQTTEASEVSIQEQITQLYVQILFAKEAKKVNERLAGTANTQWERGKEMQQQGQMARADVVQLEAQKAAADYNVVASETQIANYKRQLKRLLQLDMNTEFDVESEVPDDDAAMVVIPSAQEVYAEALATRPEIKGAELTVEQAQLQYDIARRGYFPTISLGASVGDSHNTATTQSYGDQLRNNFAMNAGLNISVPLWDQRRTSTAKEKARYQITTANLDLEDKKKTLSSNIEQFWLNATSNQQKFVSAQTKVKSQAESYELVDEQFRNGLKNVVDVLEARDQMLTAERDKLESKYNTILNVALLRFYKGEFIGL